MKCVDVDLEGRCLGRVDHGPHIFAHDGYWHRACLVCGISQDLNQTWMDNTTVDKRDG